MGRNMKKIKKIILGAALGAAFTINTNVSADDLADAAAKAFAYVNGPIAATPHALEEFPWALRRCLAPTRSTEPPGTAIKTSSQNADCPANPSDRDAKNRASAASPKSKG